MENLVSVTFLSMAVIKVIKVGYCVMVVNLFLDCFYLNDVRFVDEFALKLVVDFN